MTSTGIEALLYMKTNNSIDIDPEYPDIEILQSFATVAFDTCNLLINPFHNYFIMDEKKSLLMFSYKSTDFYFSSSGYTPRDSFISSNL